MLPAPVLQLLPVSGQELGSGTVDCAQVWLARPRESSIRLQRERHGGAGDSGEALTGVQTVVAVGVFHLQHQAKEAHQTSAQGPHLLLLRARAHTHTSYLHPAPKVRRQFQDARVRARTHTLPPGVRRRPQDCPGSQERIGHRSASPPQDPVCPYPRSSTSPAPKPCPPNTRVHTRHLSPHLGTRGVRAVFSAAPGPGGRGDLWGLQGIPSSSGPPTCTSPTRPPLAGVRARGACLDPGVVRRGARLCHL